MARFGCPLQKLRARSTPDDHGTEIKWCRLPRQARTTGAAYQSHPPPPTAPHARRPTSPAGSQPIPRRMSNRSSSVMARRNRLISQDHHKHDTNAMPSRWPVCYVSTSSNPSGSPPRINASSSNASPRLMKIPSSGRPPLPLQLKSLFQHWGLLHHRHHRLFQNPAGSPG